MNKRDEDIDDEPTALLWAIYTTIIYLLTLLVIGIGGWLIL